MKHRAMFKLIFKILETIFNQIVAWILTKGGQNNLPRVFALIGAMIDASTFESTSGVKVMEICFKPMLFKSN